MSITLPAAAAGGAMVGEVHSASIAEPCAMPAPPSTLPMENPMASQDTMFAKIWSQHVVTSSMGQDLLYIDRHLVHDGSFQPFEMLRDKQRSVRCPELTFGTPDHYVPTVNRGAFIPDEEVRSKIEELDDNTTRFGIRHFGLGDRRQGIVHVIGPEQGLVLPGATVVCGDSHTSTHGALGALAFGIGASEVAHVLATQCLWQRRPKAMRIEVDGMLPRDVTAKDLILAIIAHIGVGGGVGFVLEYAGSAVRALSMEARLTLCNMSTEAGSRAGLVAPDDTTFEYLAGRPYSPAGVEWDSALAYWRTLPSAQTASFDAEVRLDAATLAPMVTWGTSPQDALPITGRIPDPASFSDATRRANADRALAYMGLVPGTRFTDIPIDRAFIGSCTNSRLEDLRAAASVVRGRKAKVPTLVSPGSGLIKEAAEAEGLDTIFIEAGMNWVEAGCSMCLGLNGDLVQPGERCASTSNRNFEGRQGRGARTHLMSPIMVAAAAVSGQLADVRTLEH